MRYMETAKYKHFSKNNRNELSILLKKGYSMRDIAKVLNKSPSSISREISNNSVSGEYNPAKAQHKSWVKRKYSKYQGMKIFESKFLEEYIQEKLVVGWTPEEIAGRLKLENNNQSVISFKSIYKYIETARGSRYVKYLSYRHKRVVNGWSKRMKRSFGNRTLIDQRPEAINQRKRIGDLEGDLLGVPRYSRETIAGLVDRKSRYFLGKRILRPRFAINCFNELTVGLIVLSYTLDNGPENVNYPQLNRPTYFCHPYHSWEKGTIENTFLRLRRYIPKKSRISDYSDQEISAIIDKMNNTPRKCLGWHTPREVFFGEQVKLIQIPEQITNLKCCTSG